MYGQLKQSGIGFCGISYAGVPAEVKRNIPLPYYRFPGITVLFKSTYEIIFAAEIAKDIKHLRNIKEAYIYFNNTWVQV